MADFAGAGSKPGLEIWRIEDMKPVAVDPSFHGSFYSGDSYIVLHTFERASALAWDVHFWLGSETSQDEAGVAAYKTVELDDSLGGAPVQHRECEGHESPLFCSYFKALGGLRYLEGGVASGFNHVERDSYETVLLQIKGRRNARTKQVPLAASNLNQGDVFILDAGLKLFLWTGSSANHHEKGKGAQVLASIRNSRGARPEIVIMDDEPDNAEFWELLGGSAADVQGAGDAGDDMDPVATGIPKLYRVSNDDNETGEMEVVEIPLQKALPAGWQQLVDDDSGKIYYSNGEETVWERPEGKADDEAHLLRSMLDTDDVFILDCESELFVWVGKHANPEERKSGMDSAQKFISMNSRPTWTRVTRVVEHAETPAFKSKFLMWDPPRSFDFTSRAGAGIAGPVEQKEVDVADLHAGAAESEDFVDDGSGEVTVYRITDTAKLDVDPAHYGQFFAGDSYLVHYANGSDHIIYFWLGKESATIERGSAAARAVELSDSLRGADVTQVRVVQGKEPPHFASLFKGRLIIHSSGGGGDLSDDGATHLYHVKGTTPYNTKAMQVAPEATSLNSGDCFVLATPASVTLWYGGNSTEEEQSTAASIADILKGEKELVVLAEGAEDEAWWDALGGKAEYPTSVPSPGGPSEPRLFQVSDVTGALQVEPVPAFTQDDLLHEDVYLLDTGSQLFVWVGKDATDREKKAGVSIAGKYLEAATDGRDPDTPIVQVEDSHEPRLFTANFQGWTSRAAEAFVDPYEARLAALRAEKEKAQAERDAAEAAAAAAAAPAAGAGSSAPAPAPAAEPEPEAAPAPAPAAAPVEPGKYSLDELVAARRGDLDIDFTKKEDYLTDAVFKSVFDMDREAFAKLPRWKQAGLKKEKGLF